MEVKVPCPKCGNSFSIALAAIVPGQSSACPSCGSLVKFAGQDAGKVQKVIDQLGALGPNVKVNVKVNVKRRPWWKFW